MGKRFLTTVGTSALTNWLSYHGTESDRTFFNNEINNRACQESPRANDLKKKVIEEIRKKLPKKGQPLDKDCLRILPAEVSTLLRMAAIPNNSPVHANEDTVLLWYTDTLEGFLSCEIVIAILEIFDFRTIQSQKMYGVKAGKNGFDPLKQPNFFNAANANAVVFTGGYKALIPPLTLYCKENEIPMYYLYEDSDDILVYEGNGYVPLTSATIVGS